VLHVCSAVPARRASGRGVAECSGDCDADRGARDSGSRRLPQGGRRELTVYLSTRAQRYLPTADCFSKSEARRGDRCCRPGMRRSRAGGGDRRTRGALNGLSQTVSARLRPFVGTRFFQRRSRSTRQNRSRNTSSASRRWQRTEPNKTGARRAPWLSVGAARPGSPRAQHSRYRASSSTGPHKVS
jgi:hypothetical protein